MKTLDYDEAADGLADFWGGEGDDRLYHTTIDDAVEAVLDDSGETTGTLVVHGYHQREVDEAMRVRLADRLIETLLERLDLYEELGDHENGTKPTAGMKSAARTFVDAVVAEYDVWACSAVLAVEVDIAEWVKTNAPHWLDEEG